MSKTDNPKKTPFQRESEERSRLAHVIERIRDDLLDFESLTEKKRSESIAIKKYLNENKGDMDHAEKISTRHAADQATLLTDHAERRRRNLERLQQSPYFGRIDFDDQENRTPYYIGIHSFHDSDSDQHLVHDWRAPVSSMFYHYETGPALYEAPDGRFEGDIVLKRQYKITEGKLEFMLESAMNIHDDVLQRELSRSADDQMKNIVATIQRDQNEIIRDDETHALVIQGAAGSGKTSIALHRIAFLLYKHKDTLSSEDILILSPNKVFAHYISRVLPELGEEMIQEITMEELAARLLGTRIKFQSFASQVAKLLEENDPLFEERILFKAEPEFLEKLEEYVQLLRRDNVIAEDLEIGPAVLPAQWVAAEFARVASHPFPEQISLVTDSAVQHARDHFRREIKNAARTKIRNQLRAMLRYTDVQAAYAGFYDYLAEFEMLERARNGTYEFNDVFPLIYLQFMLDGVPTQTEVKHLVVDEMQDYSPVQYKVLSLLYPCRKTILGDANQSVSPLSSSNAEMITQFVPAARRVTLNKSYRSTVEITRFSLRIRPNPDIIPVERHGEDPAIHLCADDPAQTAQIIEWSREFLKSKHQSLGIICKTQKHANELYQKLKPLHKHLHLLDDTSTILDQGIILATAHLVKGLEFDEVIIPDVNYDFYRTSTDRQMLYVACTRAMHRLRLSHTEKPSRFFDPSQNSPRLPQTLPPLS